MFCVRCGADLAEDVTFCPRCGAPRSAGASTGPGRGTEHAGKAVAGLVLGLVGLLAWLLPICGLPTTLTGLVLAILGMQSSRRGLAIAAVVICGIGVLLATANMAIGMYLGVTGQHELVNRLTR